jgi:hypothetical protein
LGDSDTATNFAFARNALFLANAIKPLPVLLPRLPVNGPGKGIDDCRAALNGKFLERWREIIESSEKIDPKATPGALAVRLLEREAKALKAASGADRDKLDRRIVQMAVECKDSLANDRIVAFAQKILGYGRSSFKQAVQKAQTEAAALACEKRSDQSTAPSAMTPALWFDKKYPSLADQYGAAISEEHTKGGIVTVRDIGEDFLAATLGLSGCPDAPTVFVPIEEKFYAYLPDDGVYIHQREPALLTRLSRSIFECAKACRVGCDTTALEFRFRDAANLSGVIRKARGLLEHFK